MAEEKEDKKVELTKEDLKTIKDDLELAQKLLVSKETTKQIEDAKEEVKKEIEEKTLTEKLEAEKKELADKLETKEKETAEQLEKLQTKVDEMISSKAGIVAEDPFKTEPASSKKVDDWSEDKINEVEEDSAKLFFGVDYDDR